MKPIPPIRMPNAPGSFPAQMDPPRIALFFSYSGQGGVERMMLNLSRGLADLGCQVDLLLIKAPADLPHKLPPSVHRHGLGASHTYGSLRPLVRYLRQVRPQALLAAKDRANQVAILARWLAGGGTRVVVRMGTTITAALQGRSRMRSWFWHMPIRMLYPRANGIVAVSDGVRHDLTAITTLPPERITVIPNPVIKPDMYSLASTAVDHPWLNPEISPAPLPVILGVGRLTRQKDFATLIRAFAKLRKRKPCRLIILGEGQERTALETLAGELGVATDVDLPGFVKNPYTFMQRAALFVLSSAWEGSPNVLTEAMALGTPVVATDCPSGPRELLQRIETAPLVTVGDVAGLARAMRTTLENPPLPNVLQKAVREYTLTASSHRYLEILLGTGS